MLLWGWSWESAPPEVILDAGWSGVLTLPREVELDSDGRLALRPARELPRLRGRQLAGGPRQLSEEPVDVVELPTSAWVSLRCPAGADRARVVLRESPRAQLALEVDPAAGTVVLDRSGWPTVPARPGRVEAPLARDIEPTIDVVFDGTVLEIFVQDRVSITERIYSQPGERRTLTVSGSGETHA